MVVSASYLFAQVRARLLWALSPRVMLIQSGTENKCYPYHQTATAKWLKDVTLKRQISEGFSVPPVKGDRGVAAPSLTAFSRDDQESAVQSPRWPLSLRGFLLCRHRPKASS